MHLKVFLEISNNIPGTKHNIRRTFAPFIFMFNFLGRKEPSYFEAQQKIQEVLALFIKAEKNQPNATNKN